MSNTATEAFEVYGKIGLEIEELQERLNEAESAIDDLREESEEKGEGIASALSGAASKAAGAFQTLIDKMAEVGAQIVDSYGQYEQLWGGVEVLFGEGAETVKENAENAFASAGLSAFLHPLLTSVVPK